MRYGKCALCLQHKELRDSHFIPKGFYRAIKGKVNDKIIHNFKSSNEVGYGDQQFTEYLLCHDCEGKFNKNGEKIVIEECYREGGFKLSNKAGPYDSISYPTAKMQKVLDPQGVNIDTAKYLYFALSMIWRKSVIRWSPEYTIHDLGDKYEEMIRQYLFSNDMNKLNNIFVAVFIEACKPMPLVQIPTSFKIDGVFLFQFIIPGITFLIALSGHKKFEDNNMISFFKCSFVDAGFFVNIKNSVKTATPKGKFAKHYEVFNKVALESIFDS